MLITDQVATATATITGVTKLPGGRSQVNFNTSGKANYLGDFTGPLTRLQDNQGNFAAPRSSSAPTGRTVCSFPSVDALSTRRTSVWSLPQVVLLQLGSVGKREGKKRVFAGQIQFRAEVGTESVPEGIQKLNRRLR
jgi:hypothetical protein